MSDAFRFACDALNDALTRAEEAIHGLKLGVSGKVQIPGRIHEYLVWDRVEPGRKRELLFVSGDEAPIHILRAPLEVRSFAAAESVAELVTHLREQRDTEADDIQESADELEAYLDRLAP